MSSEVNTASANRVLIADDDPMMGLLATAALQPAGYDVTAVADGAALLAALEHGLPDVLLLDVEMPGSDGFALCRQIRARPDGAHLPIIMVTGREDPASIDSAYAAGASDFLIKPVHWPVLPHRIAFIIRSHKTMRALGLSEQKNGALLQALPDWLFIINAEGRVLEHISGANRGLQANLTGKLLEDAVPADAARNARECMQAAAATGTAQSYESHVGTGSGRKTFETRLQAQADGTFLFVVRDITERRLMDARIQYLAYYDTLTGLPNRQLFLRELRRAIRSSERKGARAAILFVDLDRFKRINDTLGHAVGDALLQAVARRLETCIRPADFVARADAAQDQSPVRIARLGGDEFVVLLTDIQDSEQAGVVATRVRHALADPFTSEGHQFVVTPSIGISMYPDDGEEIEDLLVKADMAMYEAKDLGRNRHSFFSRTLSGRSLDRLDLENDLRRAIINSEFRLHYQPKLDAKSGSIEGVEALLRWKHPDRGPISPDVFIPLAEETGMILPLGDWVIREACRQLQLWAGCGLGHLSVSVNVSVLQFSPENFVESIFSAIREFDVSPRRLELEITESLLMRNVNNIVESLRRLRAAGIRIAIDDFGTGYSSLGYLKKFPVDTLKIDRSFVKDLQTSSDDAAICAAIIAMARELNLQTVAEGVGVAEQLEFLRRLGCNQIQGYLLSKPLAAPDLEELIRAGITVPGCIPA